MWRLWWEQRAHRSALGMAWALCTKSQCLGGEICHQRSREPWKALSHTLESCSGESRPGCQGEPSAAAAKLGGVKTRGRAWRKETRVLARGKGCSRVVAVWIFVAKAKETANQRPKFYWLIELSNSRNQSNWEVQ